MSENLEVIQAEMREMREEMREGFRSVLGEIAALKAEGLAARERLDLLIEKFVAPQERGEFDGGPTRIAAVR
jgi:hypothetical protein